MADSRQLEPSGRGRSPSGGVLATVGVLLAVAVVLALVLDRRVVDDDVTPLWIWAEGNSTSSRAAHFGLVRDFELARDDLPPPPSFGGLGATADSPSDPAGGPPPKPRAFLRVAADGLVTVYLNDLPAIVVGEYGAGRVGIDRAASTDASGGTAREPGQDPRRSASNDRASTAPRESSAAGAAEERPVVLSALLRPLETPQQQHDVTEFLRPGRNRIYLDARSRTGAGAVRAELWIETADGARGIVRTDDRWQVARRFPDGLRAGWLDLHRARGAAGLEPALVWGPPPIGRYGVAR